MGMGDSIKVSFGELEALGGNIQQVSSQIESELESLRSQISNLDSLWEGSASSGYQAVKLKWFQAADDLQQVLASIGAAVHAAEQAYQGVESKNAGAWG
ncbi:MAG TPA: WXG100 family type VII secretion target [Pseudonocardiaceae bacterium]|jgi:early secretory antigenic target protein ESAT-6|nr:WXG100 family type VII secretion target [Pseudonocardiaceae bacterium]